MTYALRGSRALTAVILGWYAATALVFATRPWGDFTLAAVSDLSLTAAALGAGVACLVRARSEPDARIRSAWRMFGLAASAWGLGEVVTTVYELVLQREIPFPSLADVGYLVTVPLFAGGLLNLAVPAHRVATRVRAVLDGLLISSAVLLISWVTVLGPVAHSSTDTVFSKVILLAYPGGDVALVTLVAYVLLRSRAAGGRPGVPIGLVCLALSGFAIGDSGYAYLSLVDDYASGNIIDAGWLGGFVVLTVAALAAPRRRELSDRDTAQLGILLPYLFIVVATLVSSFVSVGLGDLATRWIRSILILLMVMRQALTLMENSHLTRTLERRVQERTTELTASQERFRALVENSSESVSLILPDGRITYQSDSSRRVFGHASADLVGTSFTDLLDDASKERLTQTVTEAIAAPERTQVVELRLRHRDGGWRQLEATVKNLIGEPAVGALVLNSRDVSERRALENQLTHEAFHDSLTGLANRALFIDRVSHALRRRDETAVVGVLFLDLDGFKEVNDSQGHASGDLLLKEMAQRLATCARPEDTIARLGGDEFAVLIETATSVEQLTTAARRIHATLAEPVTIGDRSFYVGASIGIASSNHGPEADQPDDEPDAAQLIRNADLAMYRAKELKNGEPAFYDPAMHAVLVDRLALEADLRQAMEQHELHVAYQPTYGLDNGRLVGVEALVRWTHPVRGEVPPLDFIPLAEQTGLIHELGLFVLREACAQGQAWDELLPGSELNVGVNLSGRQLTRPDFIQDVARILEETGFPAKQLILEMTESVLMDDDSSVSVLTALKELGIRLAIDDFGTGYSSLSYLHRFPIDILKIDRSFVSRLSGTDVDESLVQSIVQLGQTLQLETIAEGIEEHGQLLALRRLGCHSAQGFHFGRPAAPETISDLLSAGGSGDPGAAVPRPRDVTSRSEASRS